MNSKHDHNKREVLSNILLRRSAKMDPLYGIGNLSALNPDPRIQGSPLSSSYIQPYGNSNLYGSDTIPPPLPRRDYLTNRSMYSGLNGYSGLNSYGGMNGLYSPFNSRRYSSMYSNNYYSPYSNYRNSYGMYGASNDPYNNFLQMAEESTRPAFETIESVVEVVNSISMMLESTFHAIHSSYSAILSVVGQFSSLKSHLAEVFSILTMLKGLQWLCLKVLYLLGLRKTNPSVEAAWRTATKGAVDVYPAEARGPAWPFLMFLSLVIGAPWLMFKLLSKTTNKNQNGGTIKRSNRKQNHNSKLDPNQWTTPDGKRLVAYAAYDFTATRPGELSFIAGEKLTLSPKDSNRNKNWALACNENNESGLIPMNYMKRSSARGLPSPLQQRILHPNDLGNEQFYRRNNNGARNVHVEQQSNVPVSISPDGPDTKSNNLGIPEEELETSNKTNPLQADENDSKMLSSLSNSQDVPVPEDIPTTKVSKSDEQ